MDEYLITVAVCVAVTIPIAYFKNRKFQQRHPDKLGYMWGFIQGTAPIVMSVILSIMFVIVYSDSGMLYITEPIQTALTIAFIRACFAYGVIKRNRWIFIIHTILSGNPLLFIINGFYIKNRWTEMKHESVVKIEVIPI